VIAVHAGSLALAREHSERALRLADEQFGFGPPQHLAVLGQVAMQSGDSPAALVWFRAADERAAALGWREPSLRWWTVDHAALLLEFGRIDDGEALLEAWQADAIRVGRVWVLADVTRGRGLVAAARGQVDAALARLEEAVTQHDAVGNPFGRAQAQLALGRVLRRSRQKRRARAVIEAAAAGFDAVGARGLAKVARSELGRIDGRRQAQGLTPAENRVAVLVAQGRTNKEVAAALMLGEGTLATHLTHIYRKLSIRSRTELAHRVSRETDHQRPKPQRF
jgi:DNA-binding CsgD family transcriptional regulator